MRPVLTPEQLGAATAALVLDSDAIATLDEDTLRAVLDGLVRMPDPGPEERAAAQEASRRYLDEIM